MIDVDGEYNLENLKRLEFNKFEDSGEVRTTIADQTTRTIILPLVDKQAETTLAATTTLYAYTVTLTSATGFAAGQCLRIIDPTKNRFYCSRIVSLAGNVATLDTQLDDDYLAGSQVVTGTGNMNVDGSVTPAIYKLRLGDPSTQQTVDITRILIQAITDNPASLDKFGDITALVRGLAMRRINGDVVNIYTVKQNQDIAGLCGNFTTYSATNPAQGQNGFLAVLTFAGQSNLGVALRIEPEGNLEVLVQDDLTDIISLRVVAEGHVVQ